MMDWLHWAIFTGIILVFVLVMVMVLIMIERRGIARFQLRPGPNRVGPFGALQPVADAIKVLTKEDIIPSAGDKWVHWMAPVIVFVPAFMIFAVVPFQKGAILADLNIGILYIIAISSVSVVGVFMAGWGSNNKYSLIGAMRAVAQMVSYEIPLVLSIVGVVLAAGALSMTTIVENQSIPYILLQPLGFLIFFLGSSAELNRTPFDLLEAESEIVAGYHTEYSGMKFALFYLGEYAHALAVAAVTTVLFLGGWKLPWGIISDFPVAFIWFMAKMVAVFLLFLWVRATIPRLRVDQVMAFAWKGLFPLALANMFIIAVEVLIWPNTPWPLILVNFAAAGVLIVIWSRFFHTGGGRVEV